jgi:HTH-type transcriptional regulator/antitoxin HigA
MKPIKTPADHDAALARVDALLARANHLTAAEQDELEVLGILIAKYEDDAYPLAEPTPRDAIRFRMEQLGKKQKDLAALVGTASRASEILAGKRGLTMESARRLHEEWGIPAAVLLGAKTASRESRESGATRARQNPKDYPLKQMFDRGWFPTFGGEWKEEKKKGPEMLDSLFKVLAPQRALLRQSARTNSKINPHALAAWQQRVFQLAEEPIEHQQLPDWEPEVLTPEFVKFLVGLSAMPRGPKRAREALAEIGIPLVIEPRLDRTLLDGAAFLMADGRPVVGLTLRYDRLDNFWFTLLHELGHVKLHLDRERPAIFDSELEKERTESIEKEADRFALDASMSPEEWQRLSGLRYADDIRREAKRLNIHPALIAGRLRRQAQDFRKHRTLIGQGDVRKAFNYTPETWPK